MSADFSYVRTHYGVPAELGRHVTVSGRAGVITEGRGHWIGVTFDDEKPGNVHNCHPLDAAYGEMGAVRPLTKSQRRYLDFLEEDSGLTFGEWLKTPRRCTP